MCFACYITVVACYRVADVRHTRFAFIALLGLMVSGLRPTPIPYHSIDVLVMLPAFTAPPTCNGTHRLCDIHML